MAIYAPNELLVYAFDAYHRNNADDLGNVILNCYDDVAVRTTKTLIWEKYGHKLSVWKDRRNTVGNPTNAKEKEVTNVVMSIRTIDEKFSDVDELPIIFVAIRMKNLPDRGDIFELSVRNRFMCPRGSDVRNVGCQSYIHCHRSCRKSYVCCNCP